MKAVIMHWLVGIAWLSMSGPSNALEGAGTSLQDDELHRLMQAVEREMAAISSRLHTLEQEREILTDQVEALQQQLDRHSEPDTLRAQD